MTQMQTSRTNFAAERSWFY